MEKLTDQSPIASLLFPFGVVLRVETRTRLRRKAINCRPSAQARTAMNAAHARSAAIRTLHLDMIRKTGIDEVSAERKKREDRELAEEQHFHHPLTEKYRN